MTKKLKVLFLCTGNTARSQMAEGWLRKAAGERFEVYSAGLEPSVVNPLTIRVMEEAGVDMGGAYSKSLGEFIGKVHFGYLITVCSKAEEKCPIFPGAVVRFRRGKNRALGPACQDSRSNGKWHDSGNSHHAGRLVSATP